MQKLIKKAEQLAARKEQHVLGEIKSALNGAVPEHISVQQKDEAIEVEGSRISQQLIENSSLRDVAFLMRGVR